MKEEKIFEEKNNNNKFNIFLCDIPINSNNRLTVWLQFLLSLILLLLIIYHFIYYFNKKQITF